MIKFSLKNDKGFTLLEALVAISILMVAVVAPITIAQKGLSSAIYTKNQMIASYLAQDAIEYIKNWRDENLNTKPKKDWLEELGDCKGDAFCKVDTINNEIFTNNGNPLKKDDGNHFYNYRSGVDTEFVRKVNIKEISDDKAELTVTVSWGGDDNQVVVTTLIFNN